MAQVIKIESFSIIPFALGNESDKAIGSFFNHGYMSQPSNLVCLLKVLNIHFWRL
jgi:hypothetical protein